MAKQVRWSDDAEREGLADVLFKSIQSCHVNFLIGAGASCPGIPAGGEVEQEIVALLEAGDTEAATEKTITLAKTFAGPTRELIAGECSGTVEGCLENYVEFIQTVDALLSERKTSLLPRQASIFTTNYDLFIEKASEACPSIILNDGFYRAPSLTGNSVYRSERLFDVTHHTGNHYDYTAEIPSINLIKVHGSLSWQRIDDNVVYKIIDCDALENITAENPTEAEAFLNTLAIVLPTKRKFRETILDRTYYDLLRVFANVLERENTLLFCFGFSFRDEHILDIVRRALRNPTLLLVVSCYSPNEVEFVNNTFASYNNVIALVPQAPGDLNFKAVNKLIRDVLPKLQGDQ